MLFDVEEGIAKGKALDIAQSTSVDGYNIDLVGTSNYEDIKNSDVIIITAGVPRKPGMTRDDLLETNLKIINQVCLLTGLFCIGTQINIESLKSISIKPVLLAISVWLIIIPTSFWLVSVI